jgi:ubiquitin-protein ligase
MENLRRWYGVIFVRSGMYKGAAFKFVLDIPEIYPEDGPHVMFTSYLFHPLVHSKTGELDLTPQFPKWKAGMHYIVHVLAYIKRVLYRSDDWKNSIQDQPFNKEALVMFDKDREKFQGKCIECVEQSLKRLQVNDEDCSIKITESKTEHSLVVRKIFSSFLDFFKKFSSKESTEIPEKPSFNYSELFGSGINRMQ